MKKEYFWGNKIWLGEKRSELDLGKVGDGFGDHLGQGIKMYPSD